MATLYVDEQGALIRKRDQQILVTKQGKTLREVPLHKVERIVLMGRGVQISTALMVDLLQRGVPVLYTSRHGGTPYGMVADGPSHMIDLRMKQMVKMLDPTWSLALARAIVAGKLANQRTLLRRAGWPSASIAIVQLDQAQAAVATAPSIDTVRGHEGAGAAAYFGAWRTVFAAQWGFAGRAYYPPPDPLNAALSFGYTLLFHDVRTNVYAVGLDPYLGAFHAVEDGRPSLALDLMEEFRPLIVDRMVLELLGQGHLSGEHFEQPVERPNAVHLNATGRAIYLARYEALMHAPVPLASNEQTALRRVLLLQAQGLARLIREEQPAYVPYVPE